MSEALMSWIVPFTFIPGVAGLILSTSNRFFHVNGLIRVLVKEGKKDREEELAKLLKRSRCFHSALTFFYMAIGCFSIAALLGALHTRWFADSVLCALTADGLIVCGVVFVVFASVQMVRESMMSYRMIRKLAGNP